MNNAVLTCPQQLTVTASHDFAALATEASDWNALAGDNPFLSWEWLSIWWKHYQRPGLELLVLTVRDESHSICAIVPWYIERSKSGARTIRFLGSGEVCSDYLTILAQPELASEVTTAVAEWLLNNSQQWNWLDLSGIRQDDPAIVELIEKLQQHNVKADSTADLSCWRSELSGTWDEFLAGLSKSRREKIRSLLRKTIQTGAAVVHCVESQADLEQAFGILIELHQKRRQSLDQSGCFISSTFGSFHREVTAEMLQRGRLRMRWIEMNGRPAAVEYSFTGGETIYYYQGGLEPELAAERPGWLSFATTLKSAIEEGYRYYDFLRGDESYKSSWKAAQVPLVRIRAVGPGVGNSLRWQIWRGREAFKSLVKSLRTGLQAKFTAIKQRFSSTSTESPTTKSAE